MVDFNGNKYSNSSDIQKNQSKELFEMINNNINNEEINTILDIGCGSGEVTNKLINSIQPNKAVCIDDSESQIKVARNNVKSSNANISLINSNILDVEFNTNFDMIFSNAALHWVANQDDLYYLLSKITNKNGYLSVHQGAKNSYQELHEISIKIMNDMGYKTNNELNNLEYHNIESIKQLLSANNFQLIESKINNRTVETDKELAEAFSEASLLPYRKKVDEEKEFVEEFINKSVGSKCSINRLYYIGRKL